MNAETKCKNCGNPLGLHRISDCACPIQEFVNENSNDEWEFQKYSFFHCDELLPQPVKPEGDWPKKFQAREGLRKVVFSRYLSQKDKDQWKIDNPEDGPVPTKEMNLNGYFHQFGNSYEEFEAGPGNYSTAIVEDESGQVFEVFPSDVEFVS